MMTLLPADSQCPVTWCGDGVFRLMGTDGLARQGRLDGVDAIS